MCGGFFGGGGGGGFPFGLVGLVGLVGPFGALAPDVGFCCGSDVAPDVDVAVSPTVGVCSEDFEPLFPMVQY